MEPKRQNLRHGDWIQSSDASISTECEKLQPLDWPTLQRLAGHRFDETGIFIARLSTVSLKRMAHCSSERGLMAFKQALNALII